MRHLKDSVLKRWHTFRISPGRCRTRWQSPYWVDADGLQNIACVNCRVFDGEKAACSINFGTPLRKCVVASIEAHFFDCGGQECLELGYGRFNLARNLIVRSGGFWTGIDPAQPVTRKAELHQGGHGSAAAIPFPDNTFDQVFGIQSFEHWGQKFTRGRASADYAECLAEVSRVLKPGGKIYLDAPIHFHGHEMFIIGDLPRIRSHFKPQQWQNVVMQCWRRDHAPLEKYPPNATVLKEWPVEISSYSNEQLERVKRSGSVWLLTVTAQKAG